MDIDVIKLKASDEMNDPCDFCSSLVEMSMLESEPSKATAILRWPNGDELKVCDTHTMLAYLPDIDG
ncbi:MAG: hypothetical protein D6711_03385 [Chloroflexi bacterium]|nr:MAG: hypothetical protein D6711_03385 [Chloroflexota bacterium]